VRLGFHTVIRCCPLSLLNSSSSTFLSIAIIADLRTHKL